MSLLSDADISRMRDTLDDSLGGTAIIQSESVSDNAGGGGTVGWTPAGTIVCRIAPIRGSEREIGNRIAEDAEWIITLPAPTVIDTDSRVVITGADKEGTFEVIAIRDWSRELSKRCECREVV